MFSFFKKKEPESPPKEKWSQSTGFGSPDGGTALGHNAPKPLKFHPTLVSQLKKDHSDLLGLFGQINTMGEARDWKGVAEKQLMFRGRLTDHLLVEAVKLYSYLKMVHQGDEHTLGVVKEYSTEMAVVMGHLKENQSIATDPVLQTKFHETWNAIGVSLVDRITREEKILYPLYDDR